MEYKLIPIPEEAPIIICIKNNNKITAKNVQIGYAFSTLYRPNYGLPNGVEAYLLDHALKGKISQYTYGDYLYTTTKTPFVLGTSWLASKIPKNVQDGIYVKVNGLEKHITTTLDPYRNQSGLVILNSIYAIDGTEIITFTEIDSESEITLYLYKQKKIKKPNMFLGFNEM